MNVTTILYLTNSELFGRSTASSQYFLQLASYLGIPVIAWNADNSGLERRVSKMNGSPFDAVISTGKCIEGWFISNHCSLFQDKVSFFIIILLMFFSVSFQACIWPEKKMHTDYLMFLDYVFTIVKEGKLHLAHPVLENSPKNSYNFSKKKIFVFIWPYFPCRCCLIPSWFILEKK